MCAGPASRCMRYVGIDRARGRERAPPDRGARWTAASAPGGAPPVENALEAPRAADLAAAQAELPGSVPANRWRRQQQLYEPIAIQRPPGVESLDFEAGVGHRVNDSGLWGTPQRGAPAAWAPPRRHNSPQVSGRPVTAHRHHLPLAAPSPAQAYLLPEQHGMVMSTCTRPTNASCTSA